MRTATSRRIAAAIGSAIALALVAILPAASAPIASAAAWIDEPLTGSSVPWAAVTVTAHATDSSGVTAIHLWVGDAVVESIAFDDPAPVLAAATFTWTPEAPGEHLLMVRGVGTTGGFGQPALAVVTVVDDDGPSPQPSASAEPSSAAQPTPRSTLAPTPMPTPAQTPMPTPRPTPVPTPTPVATPVPCAPAAPELTSPANGTTITDAMLNPPTFQWAHRAPPVCTPTGYRLQLFQGPDLGLLVHDVTLGAVMQWEPPAPLTNCETYYWRVATRGTTYGPWSPPSFVTVSARCP